MPLGDGLQDAFEIGREAQGRSGIGMAIQNLTDRAKQVRDLELKKKYDTEMVPQYSFDPSNGKFQQESMMPKGSIVRNRQTPLEVEANRRQVLGQATATGKQAVQYGDLINQFSFIENDMNSVLSALQNVPSGRLNEFKRVFRKATGSPGSEDIFLYEGNRDLILSKIAKTFGGEVGVLTEGDIQRIRNAFPATWMNERERAAKMAWVKQYIRSRIEAYKNRVNTMGAPGGTNPFQQYPQQDDLDADIDFVNQEQGTNLE